MYPTDNYSMCLYADSYNPYPTAVSGVYGHGPVPSPQVAVPPLTGIGSEVDSEGPAHSVNDQHAIYSGSAPVGYPQYPALNPHPDLQYKKNLPNAVDYSIHEGTHSGVVGEERYAKSNHTGIVDSAPRLFQRIAVPSASPLPIFSNSSPSSFPYSFPKLNGVSAPSATSNGPYASDVYPSLPLLGMQDKGSTPAYGLQPFMPLAHPVPSKEDSWNGPKPDVSVKINVFQQPTTGCCWGGHGNAAGFGGAGRSQRWVAGVKGNEAGGHALEGEELGQVAVKEEPNDCYENTNIKW